jgi:hypothetical protein
MHIQRTKLCVSLMPKGKTCPVPRPLVLLIFTRCSGVPVAAHKLTYDRGVVNIFLGHYCDRNHLHFAVSGNQSRRLKVLTNGWL